MEKFTRPRLDAFLQRYATEAPVLDIGSSFAPYKKYFPNCTTVDIDAKRNPDIVGDVHALPIESESQDNVLFTEVLEHCYDPKQAISELHRVLKKGGTLILTTRFVFPIHGGQTHDYFRFTEKGLRHLLADFEIVELQAESTSTETIAVLMQRLIFQTRGKRWLKLVFRAFFTLFLHMPRMEEYTNIERTEKGQLMTSGYYLVARKL